MNRLNGRMKGGDLLGHVYLDGEEHKHIGHLNPGFVPQFDIMHSGRISSIVFVDLFIHVFC